MLLDKLQPDTIVLEPDAIGKVGPFFLFWVISPEDKVAAQSLRPDWLRVVALFFETNPCRNQLIDQF
jgi:hypothetical protein